MRRPGALVFLALCALGMVACLESAGLNELQQAATSVADVVTESVPLRSTSGGVLATLSAGSKTQVSPLKTGVASLLNQPDRSRELVAFGSPHRDYTVLDGCNYKDIECASPVPHTGVDSVVAPGTEDSLPVDILSIAPGVVARIQYVARGCTPEEGDCGLGNAVILEHVLRGGERIYSLYAHLDSINAALAPGMCLARATPLGVMGASGYGDRSYWQRIHLHLEIKTAPVLGDPRSAAANPDFSPDGAFFGYITTPSDPDPDHWGFTSPTEMIAVGRALGCP